MDSRTHPHHPDRMLEKWCSLPPKEKKLQFEELSRSSYWHSLPEAVRARIEELISN